MSIKTYKNVIVEINSFPTIVTLVLVVLFVAAKYVPLQHWGCVEGRLAF
jgi:hypothetical protein